VIYVYFINNINKKTGEEMDNDFLNLDVNEYIVYETEEQVSCLKNQLIKLLNGLFQT
jgi:hypothetical protein